ncbi:hypothetical protein DPMN_004535 [Dreissena polymorpha]|uniref:Uncharacterized protein n=1 Tax=Dreissena polymorpha TaxID=45954 RepID=A0A9D4MRW6_DREPO|nr:hypothetical protein DPMN_004535 [Dreissena polymorpha]
MEVVETEQWLIGRSLNSSDGTQEASDEPVDASNGEPLDASGDMPHVSMGSTKYDRSRTEDCMSNVMRFHLHISDPESAIQSDRSLKI